MPQLNETIMGREIGYKGTSRYIWRACLVCGKEEWAICVKGKPRCTRCGSCGARGRDSKGKKSFNWKGGRIKRSGGYILVYLYPDDFFYPMANKQGYVMEHRLVVAKALNRCLLPWETVHHKEGYAKNDNRYPESLVLLPHQSKHNALTRMSAYIKKLEREIEILKRNT